MGSAYHTLVCHFWPSGHCSPNRCSPSGQTRGDLGTVDIAAGRCVLSPPRRAPVRMFPGRQGLGWEGGDGPWGKAQEVGFEVRGAVGDVRRPVLDYSLIVRRGGFKSGIPCPRSWFMSERLPSVLCRAGVHHGFLLGPERQFQWSVGRNYRILRKL